MRIGISNGISGNTLSVSPPSGATLFHNFITNKSWNEDGDITNNDSSLDCVRSSSEDWAEDTAGNFYQFAANKLRRTNKGVLIEPAAENLFFNPLEPPNSNNNFSPLANLSSENSPDGGNNAWRLDAGATGFGQENMTILADAESHIWSVIVAPVGLGAKYKPVLTGINGIDQFGANAEYDFDTDTFNSDMSQGKSHVYPNGWVRLWATFINDGTGTLFLNRIDPQAGNEDGFKQWVWNVVKSDRVSSPITAANGVRGADIITDTDLSWLNNDEGTFVVNYDVVEQQKDNPNEEDIGYVFSLNQSTNRRFEFGARDNDELAAFVILTSGGFNTGSFGYKMTRNNRMVVAYKDAELTEFSSAGLVKTELTYTPPAWEKLSLGHVSAFADNFGHYWIRDFTYYNTRLSSPEVISKGLSPSSGNVHLLGDSFVNQTTLDQKRYALMDEYRVWTYDGVGGRTMTDNAISYVADTEHHDRILLIHDGSGDTTTNTTNGIDSMISNLTNSKWAYLEPDGAVDDAIVLAVKDHIETTYGAGHYIETLAFLQSHNDGSANDLADVAAGLVPRSLRTDSIHLTDEAHALLAETPIKNWLEIQT